MRIGYLEDDQSQADLVKAWLAQAGYACLHYGSGLKFQQALRRETVDLCLLDWELPDLSGIEVLEWIRTNLGGELPVLFTTVRGNEEDIATALNAGADDYVTKPMRRLELLARIDAVMRRSRVRAAEAESIRMGSIVIDSRMRTITRDGEPVVVTPKEFEVASCLFQRVGVILSRKHLLDLIWGQGEGVDTRTVDTHMSRIRTKLGLVPEHGWRLSSVQHVGYRLERLASH